MKKLPLLLAAAFLLFAACENNESEITEFDSSALTSIFGKNTVGEESEMSNAKILAKLPIYGSNYFNNENINSMKRNY